MKKIDFVEITKNWNFAEFQFFMIFEKLRFFEFYNYTNDRIFKHHLLGQEDRNKCIIWVRTWLRAHTVSIIINLKSEILVFLIETFGGGTISARASTRAPIWCAPIGFPEQGDNLWVIDCYRSSKTCYCRSNWSQSKTLKNWRACQILEIWENSPIS